MPGKDSVPAAGLSHGDRRKLELAMALASEPKVLLLDEPMAGVSAEDVEGLGRSSVRSATREWRLPWSSTTWTSSSDSPTASRCCTTASSSRSARRTTSPATSGPAGLPGRGSVTTAPVLTVEDLHVHYGGSHILQGVTFEVPARGVTALLGRNGVGKTTTLKAILGLAPRRGRIVLQGNDIERGKTFQLVRGGIGYVPEDRDVFGGLTVDENLRLVGRDVGAGAPVVGELFPDLVTRRRQRAGTLSGGQQQMSPWRESCCGTRPPPRRRAHQGAAPKLVTEVADVLARVAETTPILLVEQNLPLVRRIADTVVVLDAGHVVHQGDAAALLADADLTRELLGVSMRRPKGESA